MLHDPGRSSCDLVDGVWLRRNVGQLATQSSVVLAYFFRPFCRGEAGALA